MKKRNEFLKDPKFARAPKTRMEGKENENTRFSSARPARDEERAPRFERPEFKSNRKKTERLFNKPTLKRSDLERLKSDEYKPSKFERERYNRAPRQEPETDRARPGDSRNRTTSSRDESRSRRTTDRNEYPPRSRQGADDRRRPDRDGDRPRRGTDWNRDTREPRRDSGSRNDAPRYDSRRQNDGERPSRENDRPRGERPARRTDRNEATPRTGRRNEDRLAGKPANGPSEGESRRVGKLSRPPRYDFSEYDSKKSSSKKHEDDDLLRLNRYIANAGICSRREADELIEAGQITVNGSVVTELGMKVKRSDTVKYGKQVLNPERMVYLLINKPKDYITTTEDPEERRTVMDMVAGACEERIYPVGRLDRNTTGLLLLTNDGELARKLTHPSGNVKKIYQVELDKPITTEDFEAMQAGFELEDGFVKPDSLGIVTPDAQVIGIEIHSGKNRIVRRMFEHFGYEVQKLDRTVFAGLNKKDIPRGKWRFLTEKEVIRLKFLL